MPRIELTENQRATIARMLEEADRLAPAATPTPASMPAATDAAATRASPVKPAFRPASTAGTPRASVMARAFMGPPSRRVTSEREWEACQPAYRRWGLWVRRKLGLAAMVALATVCWPSPAAAKVFVEPTAWTARAARPGPTIEQCVYLIGGATVAGVAAVQAVWIAYVYGLRRGGANGALPEQDEPSRPRAKCRVRNDWPCDTRYAGAVSRRGPVKPQNEDAAAAVTLASGVHAVVVADGLSAHPGGAKASRGAVDAAVSELVRLYGPAAAAGPDGRTAVGAAIAAALARLQRIGREASPAHYRTTLIVVLCHGDTAYVGWVGDGGVYTYDPATGAFDNVLVPHKQLLSNRLEASLGPVLQGRPTFTQVRLPAHGWLLCGSDGLLDPSPSGDFAAVDAADLGDTVAGLFERFACVEKALRRTVDGLLPQRANGAYIFTDNVSLAAVRATPNVTSSLD